MLPNQSGVSSLFGVLTMSTPTKCNYCGNPHFTIKRPGEEVENTRTGETTFHPDPEYIPEISCEACGHLIQECAEII